VQPCIEVVDEERVHRMAGMLRSHLDEYESMLGEFPHGLRGVRQETGSRAQQSLVPGQRPLVVADRNTGEEVDSHGRTLLRDRRP